MSVSTPSTCSRPSEVGSLAVTQDVQQSTHEISHQQSTAKTTSVFSTFLHLAGTPIRLMANLFGRVQHDQPEAPAEEQAPEMPQTHNGTPVLAPTPIRSTPIDEGQEGVSLLRDIDGVPQLTTEIAKDSERLAEEPLSLPQQTQHTILPIKVGPSPVADEEDSSVSESLRTTEKLDASLEQPAEEPRSSPQQLPLTVLFGNAGAASAEEGGYVTEDTVEEVDTPRNKVSSAIEGHDKAPSFEEIRTPEERTEAPASVIASPSSPQIGSDSSSSAEQIKDSPERAIEALEGPAQEIRHQASTVRRKKRGSWNNSLPTPSLHVCQQGLFRRRVYKVN